MVPSKLVPRENSKKVIVAAVVGVEPDKVRTVGFFLSSDCWRITGINKKVFQDALQAALDSAGLTVQAGERRAPDFALEVRILEQAEEETFHMLGVLTRRARLVAIYSLKSPQTDELVWAKEISTEHEVKWGLFVADSPSHNQVSVIAFEAAIKLNLETFVRYLGDL